MGLTTQGYWRLGIGDPSLLGWTITIGYLVSAVLCASLVLRTGGTGEGQSAKYDWRFWNLLAVLLLLLGVNKQLDLQTWLILTGRAMAKEQGWYEYRRWVEGSVIGFLGLGGVVLAITLVWLSLVGEGRGRLAIIGVVLLIAFVLVRAFSIENLDKLLGTHVALWHTPESLEIGGVLLILTSVLHNSSTLNRSKRQGTRHVTQENGKGK